MAMAAWLGDHADWAEQCVTDDWTPQTGHSLPHVYNLDLDQVLLPATNNLAKDHSFPWKA